MICIHRRRLHLCLPGWCRWRFRGNLCSVPERCEGRSDQACVRERPGEGPRGPPSSAAAPRRSADDAPGRHVTSKVLLAGGCVLTLGARTSNHKQADVLIDGEMIAEVGTHLRARDAEQVDATGTIVMPGFVDTHRHAWTSLLRNAGERGAHTEPADGGPHGYTADDVYASTLIGLLGAAEAGITTVVDW